MQTFPSKGNKPDKVFLTTAEHQQAIEAAVDRETRLAMRAGAHSLRRQSIVGAPLSGLREVSTSFGDIHLFRVRAKDSSDRPEQTVERDVFLCRTLVEEIYDHHGRDHKGPIFTGQKSTLNNRYRETRQALHTQTGNADWLHFSPHDGRRYFASHALFRHNISPELVMQLGGWNSMKALQPYLVIPEDVMTRMFGTRGLLTSFDTEAGDPPTRPYRVNHAIDTIQNAASSEETGPSDLSERELAHEVAQAFDDSVLDTTDIASPLDSSSSDTDAEDQQAPLDKFTPDETGNAYPLAAAKVAYYSCVVLASWSATFGTLG